MKRYLRIFIEKYIENKSINHVRQKFSLRFNPEALCKRILQCNVAKCHKFGTSLNRNKGNSGRSRSLITDENIKRVRELLENNPQMNAQRNGLGLSASSFNRITQKEIRW